jgi:hypothetical protein
MTIRTSNKNYDIHGMENRRIVGVLFLWKFLRLDDISGKPKLRDILSLGMHHYLGSYIAIITVKYERKWLDFLHRFRQVKAKTLHRGGLIKLKLLGRL